MPKAERVLKPVARGREAAFADDEEMEDQSDSASEEKRKLEEMLKRMKEAEEDAEDALQEARRAEMEWEVMTQARPDMVYARPVQSKNFSTLRVLQSRLAKRLGLLAAGLGLLAGAQLNTVAASEGKFSKDLGAEVNPETKALWEDVEQVARRLVTIEERYAPSVVQVARRIVRGEKADYPEVTPRVASHPERLPDASPEQYAQFSQEANQLLQRAIAANNVPLGEDYREWYQDVLDPLVTQYDTRHGVSISLLEGAVETDVEKMLENYIDQTMETNPDRASRVADALEAGEGYWLAVRRHDGKLAAERLRNYLAMDDWTLSEVVSEEPENLRWILPNMTPVEQAELSDRLHREGSEKELDLTPELGWRLSSIRAAAQVVDSIRR